MKIALMQPYFLPYIGYFQLISAVDKFIFCNDLGFIKQGWINRNNILLEGKKHQFCLPIKHISSFTSIKETIISEQPKDWQNKLSKKIWLAYHKAPFFDAVYPWIDEILKGAPNQSISDVAINSIEHTFQYLNLEKNLSQSIGLYDNKELKLARRVIDICQQEGADTYINAIGGQSLFCKDDFKKHNINLCFIKPILKTYEQNSPEFVAGLSILDVLMYNAPDEVKIMLSEYNLI
jgi:WbqC-like protein family